MGMYVFALVFYCLFASGDVQPWNEPWKEDEKKLLDEGSKTKGEAEMKAKTKAEKLDNYSMWYQFSNLILKGVELSFERNKENTGKSDFDIYSHDLVRTQHTSTFFNYGLWNIWYWLTYF